MPEVRFVIMDVLSREPNPSGLDRIVREFSPTPGQHNVTEFMVTLETNFLIMIRKLQARGRCRSTISIMAIDMNLGSQRLVHSTFTYNPLAAETLPAIEAASERTRHPVHLFLAQTRRLFSSLVHMLEIAGAMETTPSFLSVSLTLDQANTNCAVTVPSSESLISSPSEVDSGATDLNHQQGHIPNDHHADAGDDAPRVHDGAEPAANHDASMVTGDRRDGESNAGGTTTTPGSTVAVVPAPVPVPSTTPATPLPAIPVRRVRPVADSGGVSAAATHAVPGMPPGPLTAVDVRPPHVHPRQPPSTITWGPVRPIGYFARFRRN